jgi:hypothetical protein
VAVAVLVGSLLTALVFVAPAALADSDVDPRTSRAMPPAQAGPQVDILIDEVEPAVAAPNRAWTLRGSVRNVGTVSTDIGEVGMSTAWAALDTASALDSWSGGGSDVQTPRPLGDETLDTALPPGEEVDFAISVPPRRLRPPFTFTSLPLRVEVSGADGARLGEARTVLPWYSGPAPETVLEAAWVVPLTVPGDPTLTSTPAPDRTQAWLDVVGQESPAQAWLDGLSDSPATFVVDPALLTPLGPAADVSAAPTEPPIPLPEPTDPAQESPSNSPQEGDEGADGDADAGRSSTSTATATPTEPEQPDLPALELPEDASVVQEAEAELQVRLGDLSRSELWWLPVFDPDVAALIDAPADPELTRRLLRSDLAPSVLDAERLLDRGRRGASWPAFDVVDQPRLSTMRGVWPGGAPLATILPRSAFTESTELIGHPAGELTSPAGTMSVLGYDERLSQILADLPSPGQDGASIQLVLAHSMARYQRQPSTPGAVVLSPPRNAPAQLETVQSLDAALDAAPWLEQAAASDLLQDAQPVRLTGAAPAEQPGDSPISPARIAQIEAVRATLADLAEIVPRGGAAEQWGPVLDGLYSTRWRGRSEEWSVPLQDMESQVTTITGGVHVNPTEVNFLAQEGLIQITVVNELPVAVQGLRLGLEPGNARLRIIEAPEDVTIGPTSRATVQFRAEAVAAGEVPVRATLSTPSGLTIGEPQDLGVQVRPTGIWIYWLLGGLAGVILILGLTRAVRRPSTSAGTRRELT